MQPVGQLSPQEWLSHPDTRAVLAALAADGATARFAGGCVRDAVLRRPVHDIDIAIDRPPEETLRLLRAAGIRAVPTGIDHGTITAVMPSRSYEITSLRRDVETDGRHAVVAFTDDWETDARRRDLTINALFADPDGAIYDPCDGLADLGARRVRFVGDPMRRIDEDVLRLLRFFRFHARFGGPSPDAAAMEACRRMAHRLAELSGERVRDEMLKILAADDPAEIVLLMQGVGVLAHLVPPPVSPGRLRVAAWLETRGVRVAGVEACALRRLAALIKSDDAADDARRGEALADAWRLSNADRDRLLDALAPLPDLPPVAVDTPRAIARRILYRMGAQRYRDQVLLAWADYRQVHGALGPLPGSRGSAAWGELLDLPVAAPPPGFPLSGGDVLAAGVAAGPAVGRILRQIEAEWIVADFAPSRRELLDRLAECAAAEAGR